MFCLLIKGDALRRHLGSKFSTRDQDNDTHNSASCAVLCKGGWWYYWCHDSNLNGLYYRSGNYTSTTPDRDGLEWRNWKGYSFYSMKFTEMKIRQFYV